MRRARHETATWPEGRGGSSIRVPRCPNEEDPGTLRRRRQRSESRAAEAIHTRGTVTLVPIEAVVFDVGGVLETIPDQSWLETWRTRLGLSPDDFDSRIDRVDPDGLISTGRMSELQFRQRYQDMLGLDDAQTDAFVEDMWTWYCGELDVELCEYVVRLRPRYRTAILSNSSDGARREEQARYGFEQLVDLVIYSHEVGVAKPDPAIYELACELIGIQPGGMVFVDDLPANVAAAAELGIHAIHHTCTRSTIEQIDALLAG
jgi:epoxide hydrolase-like predicted phosphatase